MLREPTQESYWQGVMATMCLDPERQSSVVLACPWRASSQVLAVVLWAQSGVSGVLKCHLIFQGNGFNLHGSSHSLSQTEGVAFLVYASLSKHEMRGGGTLRFDFS